MRAVALAVALAGCAEAPEGSAARYYRVLSSPDMDPAEAAAICRELTEPSARGDCGLAVATRSPDPGRWCAAIEAGTWRRECYFQAAEALRRAGRDREAVALCMESGPFRDDCGQHLWQTRLHRLIGSGGAGAIAGALPRARDLYAEWEPLLGDRTDFRHRFWRRFYEDAFQSTPPPIDLAVCEPLDPADRRRCTEYGEGIIALRERGPPPGRRGGPTGP